MTEFNINSTQKYYSLIQDIVNSYPTASPSDISLAILSTPTHTVNDGTEIYQQTVDYCGGGPLELEEFGTFDTPIEIPTVLEYSSNTERFDHFSDPIQAHRTLIYDLEKQYYDTS